MTVLFLNGMPMLFWSHETNTWLAIATELYVPAATPISRTKRNSLMVAPPKSISATSVINNVKLVFRDLLMVSDIPVSYTHLTLPTKA